MTKRKTSTKPPAPEGHELLRPADAQWVPIGHIKPHPKNYRRGSLDVIETSIRENGFYRTLVVQRSTSFILAGNNSWRAAKNVRMAAVPVFWFDGTEEQALRILAVDNRASDLAENDDTELLPLLRTMSTTPAGLQGSGYGTQDLKRMEAALRPKVPKITAPEGSVTHTYTCPSCGHKW